MFEANYPEATRHVFLINCKYIISISYKLVISLAHTVPPIFRLAYNLVKDFLHENTRSRIIRLGSEFTSEKNYHVDCTILINQKITRKCCGRSSVQTNCLRLMEVPDVNQTLTAPHM